MTAGEPVPLGEAGAGAELHFVKYTSFGNTFLVVDETLTPLAGDAQRAAFARWALNPDFGIGGTDNVLYLNRTGPAESGVAGADIAFRIFEHDGSETLSCGNGLLSTAAALHRSYGGRRWGVLTELPTGTPKLVQVGVDPDAGTTWVNVGWPRAVPADLHHRPGPVPADGVDRLEDLVVVLPQDAVWADGLPETVLLSGSLVFTGEPHLVLLAGDGLPSTLAERIFSGAGEPPADGSGRIGRPESPEMAASRALVHHLGSSVNEAYRGVFPHGVHLNFARVLGDTGPIEYRTWERAIDCETLACGSGAVAMAYVAARAGLVEGPDTEFWPHRCRWYQPDASLRVTETGSGFLLTGRPRLVCAGAVPVAPGSSAHPTVEVATGVPAGAPVPS